MSDESGWEEARLLRAEAKRLKECQDALVIAVGSMIQAHEEITKTLLLKVSSNLSEEWGPELNALLEKHEVVIRNAQQAIRSTRPSSSEPHATV